jgi:hypothetical protein
VLHNVELMGATPTIPFGGHGDLFSATGHRLPNLGVHPSKLRASPIGLGLPGGHPPNKPLWQGRGRPLITQREKHAMLIAQQIINILGKFQPHVRMGGLYSILTELLCPIINTPALPMNA